MRDFQRAVRVSLILMSMTAFGARTADACSCMVSSTSCGSLSKAAAVFEGTVDTIGIHQPPPPADRTVPAGSIYVGGATKLISFRGVRSLRGEAPATLVTTMGGGDCGYPFEVGKRYLVEAYRRSDGQLATSICSQTRMVDDGADDPLVDYLKSLDGPPTQRRVWGHVLTITAWNTFERQTAPVTNRRVTISGPKRVDLVTDSAGAFVAVDLPPGTYRVTAGIASSNWPSDETFTWTADERFACAEVTLVDPPRGTITGTIVDADGKPLRGVFVELGLADQPDRLTRGSAGAGTETDDNGSFQFDELPPGRYKVGIDVWSGPSTVARGPAGESPIVLGAFQSIVLQPLTPRRLVPVKISGRVLNEQGQPVKGVTVHPKGINADGSEYWTTPMTSDAEGSFTASLVRDERYVVIVGPWRLPLAEVEFIARGEPLVIKLTPR